MRERLEKVSCVVIKLPPNGCVALNTSNPNVAAANPVGFRLSKERTPTGIASAVALAENSPSNRTTHSVRRTIEHMCSPKAAPLSRKAGSAPLTGNLWQVECQYSGLQINALMTYERTFNPNWCTNEERPCQCFRQLPLPWFRTAY